LEKTTFQDFLHEKVVIKTCLRHRDAYVGGARRPNIVVDGI